MTTNHGGITALALALVLALTAGSCSSDDSVTDPLSSGTPGVDRSQTADQPAPTGDADKEIENEIENEIAEACGVLLVAPTLVALLGFGGQPGQYETLDVALAGGAKHFPAHTGAMERHRAMLDELAAVSEKYDIEANPDDVEPLMLETQAVFDGYGGLEAVVEQFVAWSEDPCGVWLSELLEPIRDELD